MALQIVASGRDLEGFKRALSNTSGAGVTVLEVDVPDKVVVPFGPDIPVGALIRISLSTLDLSIRAIPGVHLVAPSTYTVRNNVGTLQVTVRTNPLPLIPIAVAVAIAGVLGVVGIVGWRIFRDSPVEAAGGSPGDAAGGSPGDAAGGGADQGNGKEVRVIMGIALLGIGAFLMLSR